MKWVIWNKTEDKYWSKHLTQNGEWLSRWYATKYSYEELEEELKKKNILWGKERPRNFSSNCSSHMKAEEIVKEIIEGNFSREEIDSFYQAYKTASSLQRAKAGAIALSSLKVGAVGKITNVRPAKWNGVEVVITKINKKRIEVKEIGKEFLPSFTIPATCFIPSI